MRLLALALTLTALAHGAVPPLCAAVQAVEIPLRPSAAGLWTVPVDAGTDDGLWHFLVDTGSTHTVVSWRAARRAGLAVTAGGGRLLTPAGPVEVGAARLPRLQLGTRVREDVAVLVADLSALGREPALDGILGMDVLDAPRIVLDLIGGLLTLADGVSEQLGHRGTALPVRDVGGRLVVDGRLDGQTRAFVLDTGASATVVYEASASGRPVPLVTAGGRGVGRVRRTELAVGGLVLGPVAAIAIEPPATPPVAGGLLPASLFARIDIDRRAGLVRVQARREGALPRHPSTRGARPSGGPRHIASLSRR